MALWRQRVEHALKENSSPTARYVQLATVKPDGKPANRTVVFRGFHDDDVVTFVTDKRSNKINDIALSPFGEMAWYFPVTREQFRLSGRLTVIDDACSDAHMAQARVTAWNNLSESARKQFSWPQPGIPRDIFYASGFEERTPGPEEPPLSPFCLVLFTVDAVDHLQLYTNKREVHTLKAPAASGHKAEWLVQDVTP